jgi:hypothetical protein
VVLLRINEYRGEIPEGHLHLTPVLEAGYFDMEDLGGSVLFVSLCFEF